MMKKFFNQRGSALVIALFLIVIISVLGVSLLSVSSNSLKQVDYERTDQAVFYIAEAGMNLAKLEVSKELKNIQNKAYDKTKDCIKRKDSLCLTQEQAERYFKNLLNDEFDSYNATHVSKQHMISKGKKADIEITEIKVEPPRYGIVITSIGSIDTAKSREVTQELYIEPQLTFNTNDNGDSDEGNDNEQVPGGFPEGYAAIVSGNIDLKGSGSIYGGAASTRGNIYISGTSTGRISGDVSIQSIENISIPLEGRKNAEQEAFIKNNYKIEPKLKIDPSKYLLPTFFPDEKFMKADSITSLPNQTAGSFSVIHNGNFNATNWQTDNYTLDLTSTNSDISFKNFKISSNYTVNINVGNREVNLYVDKLDIAGHINIIGSGKVNLLVKSSPPIINGSIEGKDSAQVNLYYNGGSTVKFDGSTKLYGSIISKSAAIELTGGAALYGNIVSGGSSLKISGGVPTNGQYIIAPNANLDLGGGGNITGIVVAKNITSSGGTHITYGGPTTPLPPGTIDETPKFQIGDEELEDPKETNMIEN
ncbi:pilus assembly PilX N-terminal domain-containing protein [Bacillus ndiopicus]|uniref:pilus assembly PilX N-terminal domain-containing protein n=1 Tax=Bacillus ndiopicus TaxID=1347368 RepID=UPI0005AB1596|nr:pilus assembly PilX N-terminal domain-containing protein [Bacillus ndiopicus]